MSTGTLSHGSVSRDQALHDVVHAPATPDEEAAVVRRVAMRILPFLSIAYVVSCLDRSNIGIAALTMMPDLGMNAAQFGFGAGIFFLGYCLGEIPSNLLQVRFGARRWLARIMISWGLVSSCMALVSGPTSLYLLRVLLGLAEAGLVPGAIMYLAFWFPAAYRARVFSTFVLAIPLSMVVGAPLSAALLYLDGLMGLHGWQWLFLLEGLPAIVMGVVCYWVLTDSPEKADWLSAREKHVLTAALARDAGHGGAGGHAPIREALTDPAMWQLAVIGIGLGAGSYAVLFFLPQIVAEFGATHMQTGLLTTLPFIVSVGAMVLCGWNSDRTGERKWHIALPLMVSVIGFVVAAFTNVPWLRMVGLIVGAMGAYAPAPPFWQQMPIFFREGKHAAAAIAAISMIANVTGFVQPYTIGYLKVATGSFAGGFVVVAVEVIVAALMALYVGGKAQKRLRAQLAERAAATQSAA